LRELSNFYVAPVDEILQDCMLEGLKWAILDNKVFELTCKLAGGEFFYPFFSSIILKVEKLHI